MRDLLTKNHLTIKKIFNKFLTQPRKALEKMTGYQKLKTETKYLWWFITEFLKRVYKEEYHDDMKALEEAEKQLAWLKLQIHKAQNEKK